MRTVVRATVRLAGKIASLISRPASVQTKKAQPLRTADSNSFRVTPRCPGENWPEGIAKPDFRGAYRKRRRAFDTLFKHCKYDPAGSFAYRWECVLRRLDQTNPYALVEAIREHIWVLNR